MEILTRSLRTSTPPLYRRPKRLAKILVRHTETNSTREMTAGTEGDFTVANLAPGPYELRVEHLGFRTHVRNNIALELGRCRGLRLTCRWGVACQLRGKSEWIPAVYFRDFGA